MRDEKEGRKKQERSKQGHTNNKAKQHSTPKAVIFPKKNELPRVGLVHVLHIVVLLVLYIVLGMTPQKDLYTNKFMRT